MSGSIPRLFDYDLFALRRARAERLQSTGERRSDFIVELAVDDILERLDFIKRSFSRVLVIGVATERLLDGLRARCGDHASVVQCDPFAGAGSGAGSMEPEVVLASRLVALPGPLDLVVSPIALHMISDLPGVLSLVRAALAPDGLLLANLLGGATLQELRASLVDAETTVTGGAAPRVHPMIDVRSLGALLQRAGFALPVADSTTFDVTYASVIGLMTDLRSMGRTNVLCDRSRHFLGRAVLAETDAHYRAAFSVENGRIRATYEIITATGWAPHESQQKPLAPGSAAVRLADALKSPGKK